MPLKASLEHHVHLVVVVSLQQPWAILPLWVLSLIIHWVILVSVCVCVCERAKGGEKGKSGGKEMKAALLSNSIMILIIAHT